MGSGSLLREGPEARGASTGPGAAGTPEEVAFHQPCPLGLQHDEDLHALLKGSQLLKVKSNSWRRERFYKLQEDCKTIWQESRKVMRTPESQLCECPWGCRVGAERRTCACMGKPMLVGAGAREVSPGPGPQIGKPRPVLVVPRLVTQPGPDTGKLKLAEFGQGVGGELVKSPTGKLRPSLGQGG